MRPWEKGSRVSVGIPGSGKTESLWREFTEAALHIPVILVDIVRDKKFENVPDKIKPITIGRDIRFGGTLDEVLKKLNEQRRGLGIWRMNEDTRVEDAARAAQWAIDFPGAAGFALPEAHNIAPVTGPVPMPISVMATQWRHHDNAAWFDTQRLAMIHRTITSNARVLRVFAQVETADYKRLRDIDETGELEKTVYEATKLFAPKEEGGFETPGWHVKLGLLRKPPYKLERL